MLTEHYSQATPLPSSLDVLFRGASLLPRTLILVLHPHPHHGHGVGPPRMHAAIAERLGSSRLPALKYFQVFPTFR